MGKINKNEKGITLIALIITIIVMMIIAAVSVYEGKKIVTDAKIETLETNMLAIKAKAKGYIEEVEAETWNASDKDGKMEEILTGEKYGMGKVTIDEIEIKKQIKEQMETEDFKSYKVTENTLKIMGLNDLANDVKNEGDEYIIVYSIKNDTQNGKNSTIQIDVVYTNGVSYKGERCYTLSKLQSLLEGTQN